MGAEILEKHRAALLMRARRLTASDADAEDLAQETLLRATIKLGELEDEQAALAWLHRIAERLHIDRQRRADPLKIQAEIVESLEMADPMPTGLVIAQTNEMSACMQRYMAMLGPSHRRILMLHDGEGHTAAEIAAILGISEGAAKIRLHRARKNLKALLDKACSFSRDERGVFVCEPAK